MGPGTGMDKMEAATSSCYGVVVANMQLLVAALSFAPSQASAWGGWLLPSPPSSCASKLKWQTPKCRCNDTMMNFYVYASRAYFGSESE